MTRYLYIPVGGTQIRKGNRVEWRNRSSAFDRIAHQHGFDRVDIDGDPTSPDPSIWSRAVNGLLIQTLWGGQRKAWKRGSRNILSVHSVMGRVEALRCLEAVKDNPLEPVPRRLIWMPHSHAGAAACMALADPASAEYPPAALVTLDMPVRRFMGGTYERIRELHPDLPIVHIHSTGFSWDDRYRMLGSRWNSREWAAADVNIPIEGGHSRFLRHAEYLPQWLTLWPLIRNAIEGAPHHAIA